MSKEVLLEGKYKLGGGLGSWAKSFERGVKPGEVRYIGGIVMYAYSIYKRGPFGKQEVNWCPTDQKLCHKWAEVKAWMDSL